MLTSKPSHGKIDSLLLAVASFSQMHLTWRFINPLELREAKLDWIQILIRLNSHSID